MAKMKICDEGAWKLAAGIIRQAVGDYANYVERLVVLNDTARAVKMIKNKQAKEGLADEEGMAFIALDINKTEAAMGTIEKFFESAWCHELCGLDADYLIKTTREKSIRDMCDLTAAKLKRITEKNKGKRQAQNALREFESVKLFLHSNYLQHLTDKKCEYWLEKMKKDSECIYCDFS